MKLVVLGLSITSSWGNGHATTYRALLYELNAIGYDILFLERDVPWYASHRDAPVFPFCRVGLYRNLEDLRDHYEEIVRSADIVLVGSYVPDGVAVGKWVIDTAEGVTAFYDIDTPVTLAKLERGDFEYIAPDLIAKYRIYFSFTGGPTLERLEREYGSPAARALYCSADCKLYYPEAIEKQWALGYLGTYSLDRQPSINEFLIQPALHLVQEQFTVVGPSYPEDILWPPNVVRKNHLPPNRHRQFYCAQKFTLNITRMDMRRAGYAPSVRLFEAAACGIAIISDTWEGFEAFFNPGTEILLVRSTNEVIEILRALPDRERTEIGVRARERVLKDHSARRRAEQFSAHLKNAKSALQKETI
ncbi:MAG TPA: glycosyltransferase [Chthoniobacterales bacterium]|nr:glycosyltransferase [Chthoniobacterales bacterium]